MHFCQLLCLYAAIVLDGKAQYSSISMSLWSDPFLFPTFLLFANPLGINQANARADRCSSVFLGVGAQRENKMRLPPSTYVLGSHGMHLHTHKYNHIYIYINIYTYYIIFLFLWMWHFQLVREQFEAPTSTAALRRRWSVHGILPVMGHQSWKTRTFLSVLVVRPVCISWCSFVCLYHCIIPRAGFLHAFWSEAEVTAQAQVDLSRKKTIKKNNVSVTCGWPILTTSDFMVYFQTVQPISLAYLWRKRPRLLALAKHIWILPEGIKVPWRSRSSTPKKLPSQLLWVKWGRKTARIKLR